MRNKIIIGALVVIPLIFVSLLLPHLSLTVTPSDTSAQPNIPTTDTEVYEGQDTQIYSVNVGNNVVCYISEGGNLSVADPVSCIQESGL